MTTIGESVIKVLDWVFESWLAPLFAFLSRGLEFVILRPLELAHLPVAAMVIAVAALTALFSLLLRRMLKIEEKEQAFALAFAAKKNRQKDIALLSDRESRNIFYRASDEELDEEFNDYLAQRFALQGSAYLLPILLSLFWLDSVFPKEKLILMQGNPFVVGLPENGLGLKGVPLILVFLVSYLLILALSFQLRKWIRKRTAAIGKEPQ